MRIYDDILRALHIESVYLFQDGVISRCLPLDIVGLQWIVSADIDGMADAAMLKIKYRGSFLYLKVKLSRCENEKVYTYMYTLQITETQKELDEFKKLFFNELRNMEARHAIWDKRKEERYDIGLDDEKRKLIQFKSLEQTIIADKLPLPCIINNLSYSGALITTVDGNYFVSKKICLCLNFVQPIEQIPIIATIKNCVIKTTMDQQIFAQISLEYEAPPLEYKERLSKYIDLVEVDAKND